MSARKINKQDTSSGSNDTMPFFNKIEDNKALNQLLCYVYDDEFVLMINELSSSILAYHKSINKYFANIRILLNKMGESSYLTAIEGNCSNLENSFKKFYSNAKVVFRKMKLYRNEKFKSINENTSSSVSKNSENKTGLTIIINNNNNNNNNNINNDKIISGFSRSPQQKNSPNFLANFNKIERISEETDTSTDKIISLNKEKSYYLEKKVFNFCESVSHLLRNENNDKLISSKPSEDLHLYKNFVINKKNNIKIDFLDYLESKKKKITTKINYLITSKKKVFSDIESLIETSQKEKKEYNNQINSLKSKTEQMAIDNKNIIKKLSEKNIKLLKENELLKKNYEKEFQQLVVRTNNYTTFSHISKGTDYYIADFEYVTRKIGRYDLVGFRFKGSNKSYELCKLSLIEMKYGKDSLKGKQGIMGHLSDFKKLFDDKDKLRYLSMEMTKVLQQKYHLGLVPGLDAGSSDALVEKMKAPIAMEVIMAMGDFNKNSNQLRNELSLINPDNYPFEVYFARSPFLGYGLYEQSFISLKDLKKEMEQ